MKELPSRIEVDESRGERGGRLIVLLAKFDPAKVVACLRCTEKNEWGGKNSRGWQVSGTTIEKKCFIGRKILEQGSIGGSTKNTS